ncbi:MAG: hypothetical protein C0617_12870 [Desulfuromonas sp.]|uniref:hypothetical protein n=1 Tax=Desulfuromonas sp. TaxID=892 RepID=UPI000CB10610|nr:hypothetical protein [Desulfuromonas sp.]PLX82980.1 MAG: hypothetical protein C0617_12870 [Desulfuromonas sp.]
MSGSDALSLPAEEFLPHRAPMLLVETLSDYADLAGTVETTVAEGGLLLDDSGCLEPVALAELLAQAFGVVKGHADRLAGLEVREGFLVGIKKAEFLRPVRAGEALRIAVRTVATLEGFTVAEGEVLSGGETVASGSIKIWVPKRALSTGEGA